MNIKTQDTTIYWLVLSILVMLCIFIACIITANQPKEADAYEFDLETVHDHVATQEEIDYWNAYKQKQEELSKPKLINDGYTQTLTKLGGVYYYNGKRETYYSSNVLHHFRTAQWWADDNGFYRTSEGYFVVASSEIPQGSIIKISMGQAMVLDSGCAPGTIDVYVNW